MLNLFVDTNILLDFYHFTSEDLEELRKLTVLVREEAVILFVPDQIVDEFHRNREAKIADALKRFQEQRLNIQFPQLCKEYEDYNSVRKIQRAYQKKHEELLDKIRTDVRNKQLKADEVIQDLLSHATVITTDGELIARAELRMKRGNPPGKHGSLGDSINWEVLLATVPEGQNLTIVTGDSDFQSPVQADSLAEFLHREWEEHHGGEVEYYRNLSSLFRDRFPDIKLATELEKEVLIQNLGSSPTFAETHRIVSKLGKYSDFTPAQRDEIVLAAFHNNQVHWIIGDSDVKRFLMDIIEDHEEEVNRFALHELQELMEEEEKKDAELDYDDELPF